MQDKLHKEPQGRKTHEQQLRMLERKPDLLEGRHTGAELQEAPPQAAGHPARHAARASEFAVSRGGMHQESRDHNKHDNPGQGGHGPQKHGPAEEKC